MVALPKPIIAAPRPPLLPRLRVAGAVVTVQDGQITIRHTKRVLPLLMAEARARRDDLIAELTSDPTVVVPCARCGTRSRPFLDVVNPDHWQCDACLPADPNDQAYEAIERQAIIAEGNAAASVPIHMPPSWSDATIEPTAGARCRNCNGRSWWTEAERPKGWRCSRCHPGNHLPADRRRDVMT